MVFCLKHSKSEHDSYQTNCILNRILLSVLGKLAFAHYCIVSQALAPDSYLQFDVALLQLVGLRLELHVALLVVGRRRLEGRVEQRVHQGRLAQAGLADREDVEGEAAVDGLVDQLVGQRVEADVAAALQVADVVAAGGAAGRGRGRGRAAVREHVHAGWGL